ncbi:NADH dehydrogenase [Pseudarthrobacter sp. W1I19]|uniref:NAD(P)/FAD-dependent oxidoreductase n=1 Tax=Pseudarthrobacter sp. W1I19 TaxID=3042288 RepID=UPI002787DC2D|nr:FAD-dependent oxidoreductase [Pseudarthrobacter sp. W1I19]MDQ0925638.1 NADH dehydrogenase [Pseudarthrobacter sp. W1I19]
MRKILIIGGGYAGFYTAWRLEKYLRPDEAQVTMVDPVPYMTYQPFLPEVLAGSIEARHSVIVHRRHLRKTRLITAKVTYLNHATKTATLNFPDGHQSQETYDVVVVTSGAVTRSFPVPGITDRAIGVKNIEEAVFIRDTLLRNIDTAAALPPGPAREKLLTVVIVGGGYAGIETLGELRALATATLSDYPELSLPETHFHLIQATNRILPEVSERTSQWVLRQFAARRAQIHLNSQLTSAADGLISLSTGETLEAGLLIWTAGVIANPAITRNTDLPIDERGRVKARSDLRVGTPDAPVRDAWVAGDIAAIPDLSGGGVGGFTVPNAQHAIRQAKLLARNIRDTLRGGEAREYFHHNLGAVATLGLGTGVFQSGPVVIKGYPAWVIHRGYHVLAIPTWERKWRVLWGWWNNFWLGRDTAGLRGLETPRATFKEATFYSQPTLSPETTGIAPPIPSGHQPA